ncbi:Large tegument protein deneddylase [Frankliniella fusca]|uniref:Large tegument protein deneddylase n=1 Tax=Frankliniella fusca TaxID=407009 RepID=A0AAE1GYH8_9NEOP|nr:Large tegument protein deneddylase [Frankliniella fusca]
MKVIQGSFDQSDQIRFPQYFGRQCTANAVAACCKASIFQPQNWTSSTIDECLISGNRLFEISYLHLPSNYRNIPFLRVEELQQQVCYLTHTGEVFDGTSLRSVGTIDNDGLVIYCIEDAIICLFSRFNYGIFTCQSRSIAVFKVDNNYYLFDSHKRGKNGLVDTIYGKAILMTFQSPCELAIHIKQLHPCLTCTNAVNVICSNCQFSITAITVNPLLTNVLNSTANASTSSVTENISSSDIIDTRNKLSSLEIARMAKKKKACQKIIKKEKTTDNLKGSVGQNLEKKITILQPPSTVNLRNRKSKNNCKEKTTDMKKNYAAQTRNKYHNNPLIQEHKKEQFKKKYNTNEDFKNDRCCKGKEKYQTDESFKATHSLKMKQKYQTDEVFKQAHSEQMKEKMKCQYHTNEENRKDILNKVKESYATEKGLCYT